ncbi:unnamed protein product [Ascophyllum nodosum]
MGQAESQQQVEIAGSPTDATSGTAQYKQQLSGANIPVSRETEEEAGERSVDSAIDHSSANTVTSVPVERSWSGMNIWRRLSSTLSWRASSLEVLKASEEKILGAIPGLKVFDTDIGNGQHVHTVEGGMDKKSKNPVVLCHGYGMGVAGWHMVLSELSASTHIFANDWLGCGLSSRPKWEAKGVAETEAFFVESLERWREANGLDKMILCGHSLGGYLGVAYAEKYPQRLERLVLISPVGFPDQPENADAVLEQRPFAQRNLMKFLRWGWKRGITPGDVVRTLGPLGQRMMMSYATRRFLADFDREALGHYLYHNMAATDGSGERALGHVLKPGAWAFSPLRYRLPKIDPSISVHFIYGENDWMFSTASQELKEAADSSGTGQKISVARVPEAGHQMFLDNPQAFNVELLRVCGLDAARLVDDARPSGQ